MGEARIKTFQKDPDELLDYGIDWSLRLPSGDTIATSTWVVPAGITNESETNDSTTATIWLSGGTSNSDYDLINRITSAAGRIFEASFRIAVRSTVIVAAAVGALLFPVTNLSAGRVVFGTDDSALSASANLTFEDGVGLTLGNSERVGWGDLFFQRGGAGVAHLKNGTNAQELDIFKTDDGAGNTEYGRLWWNGASLTLGTGATGTGAWRNLALLSGAVLYFQPGGTTQWWMDATALTPGFDNTEDIGSPTRRVKNLFFGTSISYGATQILTARQTGWTPPTGTATRTSFATSTVTLEELAQRTKALIDDLTTHGLIGS